MRILITGAKGMLGTDLQKRLSSKNDIIGSDIWDFDITDERYTVKEIINIHPEIVINTAAFTDVDACEKEREKAFNVNRNGARNVALGCRETGSRLIHISTDYVFDGAKGEPYREDDEPRPLGVYGLSKLEGEKEIEKLKIQNSNFKFLIIRTSWLFGRNGKNFVETIRRLSKEKEELKVVDDQVGSPTYTVDLSEAIGRLVYSNADGIVHCSNGGQCSWYAFAKEILKMCSMEKVNVIPITTSELNRPAQRPSYSVLNNERYYRLTEHRLRKWEDGLRDYLSERSSL